VAILVDSASRVLVQGITGREGSFHAERMMAAGTQVVAGTSPGKGGESVGGVPVFDDCAAAVESTGADVALVFVPAPFARDAIVEAAEAGIATVVCVTEGVPVHDMMQLFAVLKGRGVRLVGPNCPGVVSVGQANVGIMPDEIFAPGPVGVISRSGTLTYQIVGALTRAGIGQTTCVGVGGDPVHGLGFDECLALFALDGETRAVVLVGEIGGDDEERAADYVRECVSMPAVAYIAGLTAPPGVTLGHAGAIVSEGRGTAAAKVRALESVGVTVARRPDEVPALVAAVLDQGRR
jgi:succinyl-CoA synthetase alpha subunit